MITPLFNKVVQKKKNTLKVGGDWVLWQKEQGERKSKKEMCMSL